MLLQVDEALRRILAGAGRMPAETVPLRKVDSRVLHEPLIAARDQPPFDASAMDGYAVRAADASIGATLAVVGQSIAGRRFAGEVTPGTAVRIFTGAPMPSGADTILIQENAIAAGASVTVNEAPAPGRFIRPQALDFASGAMLLEAGRRLGVRELALAAAAGASTLAVSRRPRVAFLSIGDELVEPGRPLGPGQIAASSAIGLLALARRSGADPVDLGIVADSLDAVASTASKAATDGIDILVTLGGASVGDHDLVRPALAAIGMDLDFWRIAMRPGRPMLHGRLGRMQVLGLPGNPVSSLVCSLLFLVPLIEAMLGVPYRDKTEPAVLGADIGANDSREDYVRSRLMPVDGALPRVIPLPEQDSSMLRALADADCLLVRPPHAAAATAGSTCRILRLF